MVCLWLPRGPWVAAVVLTLMVLSPPVALVRDPGRKCTPQVLSCWGGGGRADFSLSRSSPLNLLIFSVTTHCPHMKSKLFPQRGVWMPVLSDLCERPHVSAIAFQFLPGASPACVTVLRAWRGLIIMMLNQPCTGLVFIVLSYDKEVSL